MECDAAKFFRDKYTDFFAVVANLKTLLIDDDRSFQNRRILPDKPDQFIQRHFVEINLLFRQNFGTFRNNIIGPILRTH